MSFLKTTAKMGWLLVAELGGRFLHTKTSSQQRTCTAQPELRDEIEQAATKLAGDETLEAANRIAAACGELFNGVTGFDDQWLPVDDHLQAKPARGNFGRWTGQRSVRRHI